jgi:hypothetical protein
MKKAEVAIFKQQNLPGKAEKNTENLSHDISLPARSINPDTSEYKAVVPTTQP